MSFEIPESAPRRRGEREITFDLRAAFRETFLVEMPGRDAETYRIFGRMLWNNGIEENDDLQVPIKRCAMKAVIRDLEHLEEYIFSTFPGQTKERKGRSITLTAFEGRQQLLAIINLFRKALGMKEYQARSFDDG